MIDEETHDDPVADDAPKDGEVTDDAPSSEDQVEQTDDTSGSEDPDPLAELRQEFEAVRDGVGALDANQVRSAMGRIGALQSRIDQLENAENPAFDELASTQEQHDQLLTGLIDALLDGEGVLDDANKTALRGHRDRMAETSRDAAVKRLVREETAKVTPPPTSPGQVESPPEWQSATQEVIKYAKEKGVDPLSIPASIWNTGVNTGDVFAAVDSLKQYVDDQADNGATQRIMDRKAAGGKTAGGGVAEPSIDQLVDAYGNGDTLTAAQMVRVEKELMD